MFLLLLLVCVLMSYHHILFRSTISHQGMIHLVTLRDSPFLLLSAVEGVRRSVSFFLSLFLSDLPS